MSNLVDYAKKEVDLARANGIDEYTDEVLKDVLELVEVFSKQGHSGLSANMTLSYFSRLADFKPIRALTGDESEWGTEASESQNNRAYQVFRRDDGTAFDVNAKTFSDDGGDSWYTNVNSHKDITFPYVVPDKPEEVIIDNDHD